MIKCTLADPEQLEHYGKIGYAFRSVSLKDLHLVLKNEEFGTNTFLSKLFQSENKQNLDPRRHDIFCRWDIWIGLIRKSRPCSTTNNRKN